MKAITLNLWISNQPGNDSDCTDDYLRAAVAAGWTAPDGVILDVAKQTLSGTDPEVVWRAFGLLADAVAELGNGDDIDDDAGQPCLTACPEWLEGAAKSLARQESTCRETWTEFVAAVPALRNASPRDVAYVVRDASGEYVSDDGRRTPASDEAREYATREEAEAACERFFARFVADSPTEQIRYSADGSVCMVWSGGEPLRCPTQGDMDRLPVGPDMADDEIEQLDS